MTRKETERAYEASLRDDTSSERRAELLAAIEDEMPCPHPPDRLYQRTVCDVCGAEPDPQPDSQPPTRFYDGAHDDCAFDYRHNHDTRPLRQVLSEGELALVRAVAGPDSQPPTSEPGDHIFITRQFEVVCAVAGCEHPPSQEAADRTPPLDVDVDTALTLHFRHAQGCGETREFPWDCDCQYREHLALVEAALRSQP